MFKKISKKNKKIVCIVGYGKSGSTLLGNMLGQIKGYFDIGELISVDLAIESINKCSCGRVIQDCNFWEKVFVKSIENQNKLDMKTWKFLHNKYFPLILTYSNKSLNRKFEQLKKIYMQVLEQSKADVIVDSSKSVLYAYILSKILDIDVYFVHLVRDMYAVEYSMHKLKKQGHPKFINSNPFIDTIQWIANNKLCKYLSNNNIYIKVDYEKLIKTPKKTIETICKKIGDKNPDLSFIKGNKILKTTNHNIGGSRIRLKKGLVDLKVDNSWKNNLPKRSYNIIKLLKMLTGS
ncbi:MAG: sulfotransferase [Candidatus Margulisbacteria bacterium]|nr:sulfotransferase [Candidatus Margulisiibacteriota bacterium]